MMTDWWKVITIGSALYIVLFFISVVVAAVMNDAPKVLGGILFFGGIPMPLAVAIVGSAFEWTES